jgi:hypothetical protein
MAAIDDTALPVPQPQLLTGKSITPFVAMDFN